MIDEAYTLHQNEYSFVTDVLPCSYHPTECTCDPTIINHKGEKYLLDLTRLNI